MIPQSHLGEYRCLILVDIDGLIVCAVFRNETRDGQAGGDDGSYFAWNASTEISFGIDRKTGQELSLSLAPLVLR